MTGSSRSGHFGDHAYADDVDKYSSHSGLRMPNALGLQEGPPQDPTLGPAFQALFPKMQDRLASCAITQAEKGLVNELCHDINAIWDLLRAVLQVYLSVAGAGQGTTLSPDSPIQAARCSITIARSQLDVVIQRVEARRAAHSAKESLPAGMIRALFTMMTGFTVPKSSAGSIVTLKGDFVRLAYTPQLLLASLGEVCGVVEGTTIRRQGRKCKIAEAEIQDALLRTGLELDALEGVVGSFDLQQRAPGQCRVSDVRAPLEHHYAPEQTASLLYHHVYDCLAMASSIEAKLPRGQAQRVQGRSHVTIPHRYDRNIPTSWI